MFDISSVLFTQDARKLGDYSLGTRVVDERPGREDRVRDLEERAEIEALQAEIKELAPQAPAPAPAAAGTSPGPSVAVQPWYASVRQEVVGRDVIGTARRPDLGAAGVESTPPKQDVAAAPSSAPTDSATAEAGNASNPGAAREPESGPAAASSPTQASASREAVYLQHPPSKRRT